MTSLLDAPRRTSTRTKVGLSAAAVATVGATLALSPASPAGAETWASCSSVSNVHTGNNNSGTGYWYHNGQLTKSATCTGIYVTFLSGGICPDVRVRFFQEQGSYANSWKDNVCGQWAVVATNVQDGTKFRIETRPNPNGPSYGAYDVRH